MIKVAYSKVEGLDLKRAYPLLPDFRKRRMDRFRFVEDKKLSCGAYLLLKKLLDENGINNPIFKIEKYDKPYISNYPEIHFNMSHSKKYVSCAISDTEVGVDIEYNDEKIDLDIAKNYFFNSEYERIRESKNPSDEFFKYWVLKESYMKYTGLGFNLPLDSFEIINNDMITLKDDTDDIKFSLFDIDNYKLAVASKYNVNKCIEYEVETLY